MTVSATVVKPLHIPLGLHKKGMLCYDASMPWDYTDEAYEKQAAADPVWHLERIINYGDGTEKLDRKLLEKYLPQLKISEDMRAFLELLLWNKPF